MAELEDGEDFDFRMGDMDLDWLSFSDEDITKAIIEQADALGLRLQSNPTPEDIEEAKRFLGIEERGRFIQDPETGLLEGSEPGEGHGEGSGEGIGEDKESAPKDEGGTDEYGLKADDRTALNHWMGSGYREQRTDPGFMKTLEKLPHVTGVYYRGTRMTPQQFATFKAGGTVEFQKHASSTFQKDNSYGFMKSQNHAPEKTVPVMYVVRGSGYKIPRQLAAEAGSNETEVILPMGDRFKITEVTPTKDDEYGEYMVIKLSKV